MKSNPEWWPGCLLKAQVHLERTSKFWKGLLTVEAMKSQSCRQTVCMPSGEMEGQAFQRDLSPLLASGGCCRTTPVWRKTESLSLALAKSRHTQSVLLLLRIQKRRQLSYKLNTDLQRMLTSLHLTPHYPPPQPLQLLSSTFLTLRHF